MNFLKQCVSLVVVGSFFCASCGEQALELDAVEKSYPLQTGNAFQHVKTGKFVRVRADNFLVADSSRVTNAELFVNGSGEGYNTVSFTSVANGKVVRAGVGQESFLGAFSSQVRGWESFRYQSTANGAFFLISALSNKPVRIDPNRGGLLMANGSSTQDSFRLLSAEQAKIESLTQLCVNEIDAYRKQKGRSPLARAVGKESCARDQARDDSLINIAHDSAYRCGESAQNMCLNYYNDDPYRQVKLCVKQMFDEGAGGAHYNNMMDGMYHSIACGIYIANNKITMAHDFYR